MKNAALWHHINWHQRKCLHLRPSSDKQMPKCGSHTKSHWYESRSKATNRSVREFCTTRFQCWYKCLHFSCLGSKGVKQPKSVWTEILYTCRFKQLFLPFQCSYVITRLQVQNTFLLGSTYLWVNQKELLQT